MGDDKVIQLKRPIRPTGEVRRSTKQDASALPGSVFVQLEEGGRLYELTSQEATNLGCYVTRAAQRADIMTLHEQHADDHEFAHDVETLRRWLREAEGEDRG